jgi:hypothetical protein
MQNSQLHAYSVWDFLSPCKNAITLDYYNIAAAILFHETWHLDQLFSR